MKVSDLILELQKQDPDMEVVVRARDSTMKCPSYESFNLCLEEGSYSKEHGTCMFVTKERAEQVVEFDDGTFGSFLDFSSPAIYPVLKLGWVDGGSKYWDERLKREKENNVSQTRT